MAYNNQRRKYNTIANEKSAKGRNNDLQNTAQKTKY
jgi:hypothetical protein